MSAQAPHPDTQVVVLGLFLNAASVLRRLGSLGYRLCGVSDRLDEEGFRSRFGHKLVCPNPDADLEGWTRFMEGLGAQFRSPPALLPTADRFVLALEASAERLAPYFRFHRGAPGLARALTEKRPTFELAARHGLPIPATRRVSSREEFAAFLSQARWPVLLKPDLQADWGRIEDVLGAGYRKVLTADDPDALLALYDAIRPLNPSVMAQEIVEGPDDNLLYWAGFVGPDHRIRGRMVGRKLRVLPAHYGSASLVELVDRPDIEDLCARFLERVGYVGLCGIELKIDARDGVPKLIEVNPRYGLWEDIAIPDGVDVAGEAVASLFGADPAPRRVRRFGRKWVHLGRDLRALREYRASGELGLGAWLRSLTPPIVVNDLPILADAPYAWACLRTLLRPLGRKLARRRAGRAVAVPAPQPASEASGLS